MQPRSHLAAERARQRTAALQRDRERKLASGGDLFVAPSPNPPPPPAAPLPPAPPPAPTTRRSDLPEPWKPSAPRPSLDELRAKYPDLIRADRPKHRPRAPLGSTGENLSARQIAIANERFALRDYEHAGIEPVYSGGMLITLALAQRLGMQLKPRNTTNNAASESNETAGT